MSDEEVYGPELHKTTFRDALDSDTERLCDYRVIAIIREAGAESFAASGTGGTSVAPIPPKPIQSKAAALARAMYAVRAGNDDEGYHDPVSLRSCIAYTRTIRNARWLGQTLSQCAASRFARRAVERDEMIARDPHKPITAGHITGAHSQSVRVAELDRLGMARDENGRHVTANCKVLSEGVDVPALDAVAFLEPKKSVVEIIQAVGRVMRKPPGSDKSIGYVVVPIAIDRQSGDLRLDLQEEVEHMSGDWKTLGMVLQALKSHDPYLDDKISEHLLVDFVESKGSSSSGGGGTDHVWDHTELSQWFFEQAIPVLVEKSGIRPDAKDIAHWMQGTVKAAARHLYAERLGSIAAATLEIGIPRNPGEEQEKALMKACETAALIMVQASVMHHRIQSNHPDLVDEPLQGMSEIMRASNPGGMMLRDLNTLLARDFAPVLKPCERLVAAMTASNPGPGFSRAIRLIAENAGEHADDYARAGEDRAGAVFQRAMQNPSATGAYYTLPTAAILLAELACEAMRPEDKPWENASTDVSHLQILDPACGTGTLLNAMKEAIVGRMVGTARSQTAKALVEDSIVGLDVDTHALQLAATQLTLNSLDADYRRMNLWRMPYGASGSREPTLGSLELMVHQYLPQGDLLPDSPTPIAADAVRTKGHLVFLRDKLLHGRTGAILTNPPYSVGGKQARHMTKAERSVVQNRQKQLRAGIKDRASSGTARVIDTDSLSPFFSVMIEDMLREGGVLAKICPLTALTSVSGKGERAFFLRHFDVLYVVTCHRKDFNFSVDVGIHEALLVMRRREAGRRRAPATRFLSLSRQPRDADEARRFAQFVATGRGKPCGTIHHRDRAHLIRGRWTPVFYEDPGLANKADWMEDHAANQPGLVLLGDVYAPNATGQTLRGNTWSFCDVGDPQSDTDVLWSASNKVQRTLRGYPDRGAVAHDGTGRTAALMRARAGYLHVSSRHDTISGRVLTVATDRPCVGSAFSPVSGVTRYEARRLSIWMNSAAGRIFMRHRHSTKLTYQSHEPAALVDIPIPMPRLRQLASDPLYRAWNQTKDLEVPQYREGRSEVHDIWDAAAAKILGVPRARLTRIRQMLDCEPSVRPPKE